MAYCLLCGKEGWSPLHFFSNEHLKNCTMHPNTWKATWKFPRNYTDVDDFQKAPVGISRVELMELEDCAHSMISWAGTNMKLRKKPGSEKPVSNLDVKREDELVCEILDDTKMRLE